MNLPELIEYYIHSRRSLGEKFETPAIVLRAFARAIGPLPTSVKATAGEPFGQFFGFMTLSHKV